MAKGMKRFMACVAVFTLLFQMTKMPLYAENEQDASGLLKEIHALVIQNDVEISENEILTSTAPVEVSVAFTVPVLGDGIDEAQCVKKGDTASFELAAGFKLADTIPATYKLKAKDDDGRDVEIGTLTLHTNDGNKMIADIIFDGNEFVFNGEAEGEKSPWSNVICRFSTTLEYNGQGDAAIPGDHQVSILDKTFTVNVPQPTVEVNMEKSGTIDGKYIDWKIKVNAQQAGGDADLNGYVFQDDLKNVGSYIDNSFKVGSKETVDDAEANEADYNGNLLQYTFPESTTGIHYIFFRTEIPDNIYLSNSVKTIENTAIILKDQKAVADSKGSVKYDGTWIKKAVADIDHKTGTISWTISANQPGAALKNAVITDELDSKLQWHSAKFQVLGTDGNWQDSHTTFNQAPVDGNYKLGDLDSPVMLTITAKLTNATDIQHTVVSVSNTAALSWDGNNGIKSNTINSNIGFNPISKTGGSYDASKHTTSWNVNVKKSDMNNELRVLDLLVYGTTFSKDDSYTVESNEKDRDLSDVSLDDIKALAPGFNQRYMENSFVSGEAGNLKLTLHHIKKGDQVVADLLVITGADGQGIGVNDKDQSFTFKTQVTNPDIYMSNTASASVANTAALFSANQKVNQAAASVKCPNTILSKDALNAVDGTKDLSIAANVNKSAAAADKIYNYKDGSAVFRIQVNASDIQDITKDLTCVYGQTLGNVTIKDVLPEGWVFQDIIKDKKFLIYEGTVNNGKLIANTYIENPDFVQSDFKEIGKAQFTFTSLTNPYVILVKAGPDKQHATQYFDKNQTLTETNNVAFTADRMPNKKSDKQNIKINCTAISKTGIRPEDGILEWKITYNPYMQKYENSTIKDTLSQGLDLRIKADGTLDMDGISIYEMEMNPEGTLTTERQISDTEKYIRYDALNRTLYFTIPEMQKAYQLRYLTDITGDYRSTLSNHAVLVGGHLQESAAAVKDQVNRSDAESTMQRSGWIEITKTDDEDEPLPGAEFTVFAKTNDAVIRKGVTAASGVLTIRGLPVGTYYMKETKAPDNYRLSPVVYQIDVIKENVSVITRINQGTNKLTLINKLEGTSGDLRICKELKGNHTDPDMEFMFTVLANMPDGEISYIGEGGKEDGSVRFVDGKAAFTLRGGQSIRLLDLPKDMVYTVEEEDYSIAGYTVEKKNEKGIIAADMCQETVFTNVRNKVVKPVYYKMNVHILLNGEKPHSGQFTFQLKDRQGNIVQTVNNENDELVLKALQFFKPGEYMYTLTQMQNDKHDIHYDDGTYTIVITVVERDGHLAVENAVWTKDGIRYDQDIPFYLNTSISQELPGQMEKPNILDKPQETEKPDVEKENQKPIETPVKQPEQQTGKEESVFKEKEKAVTTFDGTNVAIWLLTCSVSLALLGLLKLKSIQKKR